MTRTRSAVLLFSICIPSVVCLAQGVEERWPRDPSDDQALLDHHDECADQDARLRDYLRRHGDLGVIDPERMRALVREEYERWRAEGGRLRPLSIGGTNWVNIGPTNFAGRIRAMAPDPTTGGTLYAGSATGGAWRTA